MGKKNKSIPEDAEETVINEATIDDAAQLTYEEKVERTIPIAHPIATRKLAKKIFKVAKKAKGQKKISTGIKLVKKEINRNAKGYVILAGDADPLDVISHFPVFCEENNVPYVWVPTRRDLGLAIGSGVALVALVKPDDAYQESYDEVYEKVRDLPQPAV